jgi:hypothetical protein
VVAEAVRDIIAPSIAQNVETIRAVSGEVAPVHRGKCGGEKDQS